MNPQQKSSAIQDWTLNTIKHAGWAPLLVFVLYAVAAKGFNAYLIWPWLDVPTHFSGGMAITYFYLVAIRNVQHIVGLIPRVIRLSLAMGMTALTAVVWEFCEFASDLWLGTQMNLGVADTLSDLLFGLLGAAAMLLVSTSAFRAGRLGR